MRYQADSLTVESLRKQGNLVIRWTGRSDARDPARALHHVLQAVGSDFKSAQSVEFDFRCLEYMNSSSIRPILMLVQQASTSASKVRVLYDGSKSWQRLSFMAIGAVLGNLNNVEVSA